MNLSFLIKTNLKLIIAKINKNNPEKIRILPKGSPLPKNADTEINSNGKAKQNKIKVLIMPIILYFLIFNINNNISN